MNLSLGFKSLDVFFNSDEFIAIFFNDVFILGHSDLLNFVKSLVKLSLELILEVELAFLNEYDWFMDIFLLILMLACLEREL